MSFHKSQIFFYILSAFLLGVFIFSLELINSSFTFVILISGISIVALSYKKITGLLIGFLIIAFAIGGLRFNFVNLSENRLRDFADQDVVLRGYVDSEPDADGHRMRFIFRSEGERIMVTTDAFPKRFYGDILEVTGKLELPSNLTEFDYITYLKKEGIGLVMFYPEEVRPYDGYFHLRSGDKLRLVLYKNIFALKSFFENSVNNSIPEPNAAFINGILLGTRQNIPADLRDAFSKTGTTHILAISGYNIMIISWAVLSGLIYFFKRRVAYWISVAIIVLFVILTGASASVVRAAVMGLLLSFANGYGRLYDQKNSIILAGAMMVWLNPFILVFDVGFQLSFAALLGLIYLYPQIDSRLSKIPEAGGLKEIVFMTISAQIAVLPLILCYFGNFSLISLPANILILPFIPASMLTGFLTGLSGILWSGLGRIAGFIPWAITTYQIEVVRYLSSW